MFCSRPGLSWLGVIVESQLGLEGTLRGQLSWSPQPDSQWFQLLVAMVTVPCFWDSDGHQCPPSCLGHISSKLSAYVFTSPRQLWCGAGSFPYKGTWLGSLCRAPEVVFSVSSRVLVRCLHLPLAFNPQSATGGQYDMLRGGRHSLSKIQRKNTSFQFQKLEEDEISVFRIDGWRLIHRRR